MAVTVDERDLHARVDDLPVGAVLRALHAHIAVSAKDPADAWRVRYLLKALREGDARLLGMAFVPYDDEPVTEADLAALAEAEEDVRAGGLVSHEEIMRTYVRRP